MSTIFISYARENKEIARFLAEQFRSRGADPWWDRELTSGERYIDSILRQVSQADHFILLLSAHSKDSTWVAFEVGAIRGREQAIGQDLLKIANLDGSDIPGFLGERNATSWEGEYGDGLMAILRSLGLPENINYKPPSQKSVNEKSLLVFRAGGQWMELVVSQRGMECILVDVGEQRARIQWNMSLEETVNCLDHDKITVKAPKDGQSLSQFNIGKFKRWRWSTTLFSRANDTPPEKTFKKELVKHMKNIRKFITPKD